MEPFMSMLTDFRYFGEKSLFSLSLTIAIHRATFTIHDQPSIMPSHDRMKELTDLAKKHQGASRSDVQVAEKLTLPLSDQEHE
jgi:hypothetical protein